MADRTQQAYGLSSPTIDIKRPTRVLNRAPTTKDRGAPGDLILNSATGDLWVLQDISSGDYNWTKTTGEDGGIEGTHYIYVEGNGTDTENATELQEAYDTAKADTPAGNNVWTVVVGPGEYNFSSDFAADTDYINVVSLTGQRDVIFNGSGTINVTADNATFRGLDMGFKAFTIATALGDLRCENCAGGDFSFGMTEDSNFEVSGTFIDCDATLSSFGYSFGSGNVTLSGTFLNCTAGSQSFGAHEPSSGTGSATLSGKFTNCTVGSNGFGSTVDGDATLSGKFTNCTGGNRCFGAAFDGDATVSGEVISCIGGSSSFGRSNGTGTGILSGDLWGCKGDANSFGDGDTITGRLVGCILTSGSFGAVGETDGVIAGCIDGSQLIVNEDQTA